MSMQAAVSEQAWRPHMPPRPAQSVAITHGFPLALLAAGAGWLAFSVITGPRAVRRYPRMASLPTHSRWNGMREQLTEYAEHAGSTLGRVRDVIVDQAFQLDAHVANRVEDLGNAAANEARQLRHQIAELSHDAYDSLERSGHRAQEALTGVGNRALELGGQRRVQLGALALLAGVTAALMFSNGKRRSHASRARYS